MSLRDRTRCSPGHFATRLVAGLLIASLPVTIVLGVLLTKTASSSLRTATQQGSESVARAVALRMEDWISERKENVDVIAAPPPVGSTRFARNGGVARQDRQDLRRLHGS